MKLLLTCLLCLSSSFAMAATNRTTFKADTLNPISLSTMDVRMGMIMNVSADATYTTGANSLSTSPGASLGVSLGIEDIKTRAIGYTAGLSYMHMDDRIGTGPLNDITVKTIELNATYGIQDNAYLLLGFNRSEIDYGTNVLKSKNAMQFGIGYRASRLLSFELKRRELAGAIDNDDLAIETIDLAINYMLK